MGGIAITWIDKQMLEVVGSEVLYKYVYSRVR
jgi:hypothetical protein